MKQISTTKAMNAPGLLSQAIEANGMIFTSGFIHMTPEGEVVGDTVEQQLVQIMDNIKHVLEAGGSSLDHIVKATIYTTDISIGPEFNKLYVEYFNDPLPAREMVEVKALPLGASIEISVVATK